jgi:hypothetical protein
VQGRFARGPHPAALCRVFSRLAAVAIVLFWLVMTGLLVRMQCFPGAAELLPVPVDHLFKLMFLHEQPSDLVLFAGEERIGDFHLQPHRLPPGTGPARNSLTITGGTHLNIPGVSAKHMTLRGVLDLDEQDVARRFELTAVLPEPPPERSGRPGQPVPATPPGRTILLAGEPAADRYHYEVHDDKGSVEQTGPLAALLDQPELRTFGLDPAAISGLARQQAAALEVTARRSVLSSRGEEIETYEVVVRQAGTTLATIQLSQLGQILEVKTNAGFFLLDETLAP